MTVSDGVTLKISSNVREKTTRIVAYRKGRFKYAYNAVLSMCDDTRCVTRKRHSCRKTHQGDVDALVKKLIKSYS